MTEQQSPLLAGDVTLPEAQRRCLRALCSVTSASLQPHRPGSARLLRPRDSPGKNTGAGCHFLPREIFLAQGSNPCLLHWQEDSLPLSHRGNLGDPDFTGLGKSLGVGSF